MSMSYVAARSLPLIVPFKLGETAERGKELYIISVALLVVAGLFVAARISTRLLSTSGGHGLGQDDYCVIASLISSVGLSITEIEATVHGYGNHMDDMTKAQNHEALMWFYTAQIMYKVVITLNKTALLLFYLLIFPHQKFRMLCYAGIVFVTFSGIAYIFATIFQCTPVAFYWDRSIQGGHCILSAPFWISYATINIATDFYILCLPMPLLYKLSLSKRNKWGIMACFAMGGFVCFTTIIRMTTLASSAKGTDFTYGPVPATNWSVIEANTGLICTCLPMMKQYFAMISRLLGRSPPAIGEEFSANKPRSGAFNSGGYKLSSVKSNKDEIFGIGRPWGAVDSNIVSDRETKSIAESQENIVGGDKAIRRTVDVEMWHSDRQSDRSLP